MEKLLGGLRIADNENFDVYADGTTPTRLVNNVTGEEIGGGGGDSDFTIANVTLQQSGDEDVTREYEFPLIIEETQGDLMAGIHLMIVDNRFMGSETEITLKIPLYKGTCYIYVVDSPYTENSIISGNAAIVLDGEAIKITGDCTLAIYKAPK